MHKITIREMDSGGFFVLVGCQSFFYLTQETMMGELNDYLFNREVAEKKWQEYKELIDRIKQKTQPRPETVTPKPDGETSDDSLYDEIDRLNARIKELEAVAKEASHLAMYALQSPLYQDVGARDAVDNILLMTRKDAGDA